MVKNLSVNVGDARDKYSTTGSGRSPGIGNGYPLQCSCLENSMDRGIWLATVHGVPKSQTQLSVCARAHTHTHTPFCAILQVPISYLFYIE